MMMPEYQNDNQSESLATQIAKEQAKKKARRLVGAFLKKAGKAAVAATAKAMLTVLKALVALIAGASAPVIVIMVAFVAIIASFMVLSNIYISEDGKDLNGIEKELYDYMKKTNEETVTIEVKPAGAAFDNDFKKARAEAIKFMSDALIERYKEICRRYGYDDWEFYECMRKMPDVVIHKAADERESYDAFKTPIEAVGAILQKYATSKESTTFEDKQLIKNIIEAIQPIITYYRFTELIQTRTWVCHTSQDGSRSCGWEYETYEVIVDKIARAESWYLILTKEFGPGEWTPWSGNTRRYHFPVKSSKTEIDFTRFDTFLNNDGFLDKDKVLVEAFYEIAVGHGMGYTKWLMDKGLIDPRHHRNVYDYENDNENGNGSPPAGNPTENMPPITNGFFMRPTTGKITSPFRPPHRPKHHGVDIGKGGRSGNVPIVAAAEGVVVRSYYSDSYGHCVIIEHNYKGKKYQTLYAHMTGRAVSAGQKVSKGQFLGNMGNTGRSEGAHLHFEIHSPAWSSSKQNAIDPTRLVPF